MSAHDHLLAQRQRSLAVADGILDRGIAAVQRGVDDLRRERARLEHLLSFEADGVVLLTEAARESGLPIALVYESATSCWKVTYAYRHVGLGFTPSEAARAALDRAAGASS